MYLFFKFIMFVNNCKQIIDNRRLDRNPGDTESDMGVLYLT